MPEIPDLNIFQRNLAEKLVGKMLAGMTILITRRLKRPEADFKATFEGQVLMDIKRVGKELHFTFANHHTLSIHLMLNGTMYWYQDVNENRFTIAELLFNNGTGLAITDWQKAVILTIDPKVVKVPDATALPKGYLLTALAKRQHHIKTALTDGKTVIGIGNAYVDEILYAASISPFSIACMIPAKQVGEIERAIHKVLTESEAHIMKNFPDTITEKERDFLQVHRPRENFTLSGEPILKADIKQRKTYYTAKQRLFE